MPEVTTRPRGEAALAAIRQLFAQEVYQPDLLRVYVSALKQAINRFQLTGEKVPDAFITETGLVSQNDIIAALTRFNQTLGENLSIETLNLFDPAHLDRLDKIIVQVSGPASPQPAGMEAGPSSPNIPPDLKALVEQFEKAHQAAAQSRSQLEDWSKERFQEELAKQNAITAQMHQVRRYTVSQLEWAINNSTALENLAASLGHKPEAVKRLALTRAKELVNGEITAQTFRQALLTNKINDPVFMASLYVSQLKEKFLKDDLLILTAVDKDPKTKQKYLDTALKKTKETAAAETAKAKPAIEAAAKNLQEHPTVTATARRAAQAAVKQVKPDIPPAKAARLNQQLVRHLNNPSIQEKLVVKALGIPPSQAKVVLNSLRPSLSQLAASTQKLNPLLAADPDSIVVDALRRPHLFPKPFVDALKSGKITDAEVAEIFQMARLLGVPANAVILSRWGVNAKDLAANLQSGKKWLGIIPMGHGLDPKDASIAKLSDLAAAQKQLTDTLKSPPPLLPPQIPQQFQKAAARNSRAARFSEFLDQINLFRLPSAFSYNLGRIPPLGSLGNAGGSFISGLRVQSAPINSFFNFISSAGNTVRQTPSFLTAPFRAVGSAISNTIINPVKTWAGTQIRSGLAKAGAWLAKKGITEGAKKLGMAVLGKGTAALLAQAVPIAGQIFAAALIGGDILKFLWEHKDKIGMFLGGMFLWGQMLLGNLIHLISSLGTIGLTTGIGALLGTIFIPIPFVGTAIGAGLGFGAGLIINAAGGLGAALSGLGSALGSAAASLSSFIGAITAPSAFIGLGGTVATAGLLGVGAAWAIQTFFIQPNINSGLFVAPDSGTFPPGGYIPGIFPPGCPSPIWPVDTAMGQTYTVRQGPGGWATHGPRLTDQTPNCPSESDGNCPVVEAIDITPTLNGEITETVTEQNIIISTHPGTVTRSRVDGNGGNYVMVSDSCGGEFVSMHVHMSVVFVTENQTINTGDPIGIVGNTGRSARPHLHYEFRNKDRSIKTREDNPPFMTQPSIPETVPFGCVGNCNVDIP